MGNRGGRWVVKIEGVVMKRCMKSRVIMGWNIVDSSGRWLAWDVISEGVSSGSSSVLERVWWWKRVV